MLVSPKNDDLRRILALINGSRDPHTSLTRVRINVSSPGRNILVFKDYQGDFWGAAYDTADPFPDGLVVNIRPMKMVVQVTYLFKETSSTAQEG